MTQTNFASPVPEVQAAIWAPVVPNDTTDLPIPAVLAGTPAPLTGVCKGLYINGGGVVVFLPANNPNATPVTITVADGTLLGGFIRRVQSTSTTATGIWALY
jgi:hypothetical protein